MFTKQGEIDLWKTELSTHVKRNLLHKFAYSQLFLRGAFVFREYDIFVLDSATGVSEDWAKGTANIKYSYTIELRDTGSYGFLLPQDQIEPNCRESWKALGEFALALPAREKY